MNEEGMNECVNEWKHSKGFSSILLARWQFRFVLFGCVCVCLCLRIYDLFDFYADFFFFFFIAIFVSLLHNNYKNKNTNNDNDKPSFVKSISKTTKQD